MVMRVEITSSGPTAREFALDLERDKKFVRNKLISLGKSSRDVMRRVIDSKRKRPSQRNKLSGTKKLADTITFGYLDLAEGGVVVWVGDIEKLDREAPHWFLINYGGKIKSGPVPGSFTDGRPRAGAGGKAFIYNPMKGSSFMIPKKPIQPKNYIEIAMVHVVSGLTRMSRI